MVGAGLYELALFLSLCITVLIVGLDLIPKLHQPYLMVISAEAALDEKGLLASAKGLCTQCTVRSRCITERGSEWILELQTRDGARLVEAVSAFPGVRSVNLLSHEGEVRF